MKYADSSDNERKAIEKAPELIAIGKESVKISTAVLEEFVFDGELFIIPEYELKMVEEYLDQYIYSMELFTSQNDAVDWLEAVKANQHLSSCHGS